MCPGTGLSSQNDYYYLPTYIGVGTKHRLAKIDSNSLPERGNCKLLYTILLDNNQAYLITIHDLNGRGNP